MFGWIKTQSSPKEHPCDGLRQFKVHSIEKAAAVLALQVIAGNLVRLGNLRKPAMAVTETASCPEE